MWRRLGSSLALGMVISLGTLVPAQADTVDLAGVKY